MGMGEFFGVTYLPASVKIFTKNQTSCQPYKFLKKMVCVIDKETADALLTASGRALPTRTYVERNKTNGEVHRESEDIRLARKHRARRRIRRRSGSRAADHRHR
jgi:hypothetical protein